jgi:hypothetical protein
MKQASDPDAVAKRGASSPEAQPASRHLRLLPGLTLIPSVPARTRARAGRWKHAAVQWVGLCLLALVMVGSLLQLTGLQPAQQIWLALQTGPVGNFFVPPTPTPTPRPTAKPQPPLPPGSAQVVSIIESVFGSYANAAIAVARCESSLNPSAVNPTSIGGSHATGLFQILYPSTWRTTAQANNSPYDATANTKAAYEIFKRDGYNWHEWVCQP